MAYATASGSRLYDTGTGTTTPISTGGSFRRSSVRQPLPTGTSTSTT